ncbi:MAG: hypothetical protein RMY16_18340 [Nostoc sp. DedQUE12b]|nr:hypothetical protein [Nostoc sp. DedQUE12b]MDZ8087499.1 hypothetical protein [Nostoc sp. DedQUE12b]
MCGFGISDRHHVDENGAIAGPVTDRQEWKRLMKANFKLTALFS